MQRITTRLLLSWGACRERREAFSAQFPGGATPEQALAWATHDDLRWIVSYTTEAYAKKAQEALCGVRQKSQGGAVQQITNSIWSGRRTAGNAEEPTAAKKLTARGPVGGTELYLRDADPRDPYVSVPSKVGTDGIPESLHPKAHFLRLLRKSIPRKVLTVVTGQDGKPVIDKSTGKPKVVVSEAPTDRHRISFYDDLSRSWTDIVVDGGMVVSSDINRIPAKRRPRDIEVTPTGRVMPKPRITTARAPRGALAGPAPQSDGKRVFAVTLGGMHCALYDAVNFAHVVDVAAGEKPSDVAARAKKTLVGFADASHYAQCARAKAWAKARKIELAGRV